MAAYYNENDPYAAQWLRNLIAAGHIAPGDVDERSIVDVRPDNLRGYTQCHFFAGIGGWSLALRLAGWPDDRPVWTGSCPCQPFSAAGAGKAADDERHLWPEWFRLIAACRPGRIFGEQVEAAIGWGWLDLVCSDMDSEGYTTRAAVLPACSVGAPHIRQRVWFVADAMQSATERRAARLHDQGPLGDDAARRGAAGDLADAAIAGRESRRGPRQAGIDGSPRVESGRLCAAVPASPWRDLIWLPCTDGKARPTQPGLQPLAHGIPGRVGKLRAAGNAIVPQVAAEFIAAACPQ